MIASNAAQFLEPSGRFREDSPVAPLLFELIPVLVPVAAPPVLHRKPVPVEKLKRNRSLRPASAQVLQFIRRSQGPYRHEIAKACNVTGSTLGNILDRLEIRGDVQAVGESRHYRYWAVEK